MRVLAFGAHPDDIEFRMAGTLAKYAARGDEVYMCVATNGEIGSYGMTRAEIAELRHREAQASADVIGAHLIWLGYEDEMLFDNRETRMAFIEAIRHARMSSSLRLNTRIIIRITMSADIWPMRPGFWLQSS